MLLLDAHFFLAAPASCVARSLSLSSSSSSSLGRLLCLSVFALLLVAIAPILASTSFLDRAVAGTAGEGRTVTLTLKRWTFSGRQNLSCV